MATLDFTETTIDKKTVYVAEVTASDVVNVHFEREKNSACAIKQRVPDTGEWAVTRSFRSGSAPTTFDINLVSDVYPIHWRIESYSAVISATLTEG